MSILEKLFVTDGYRTCQLSLSALYIMQSQITIVLIFARS